MKRRGVYLTGKAPEPEVRMFPELVTDEWSSPSPDYPLDARGVYVTRFLSPSGKNILYAVDSNGRCVASVTVDDPDDWDTPGEAIRSKLDEIDPPCPRLTLVNGGSHARS